MASSTTFVLLTAIIATATVSSSSRQQQQPIVAHWRELFPSDEKVERWRLCLPTPPQLPPLPLQLRLPRLPPLPQLPRLPPLPFWSRSRHGGAGGSLLDPTSFVRESTSSGEGWTLCVERDGVRVWRRTVPGSSYDEIRGNGLIKAPPKAVLSLLRQGDEETIRTYNPMYDSGHDLEQLDANTKVSYGAVRAIFPFKPRDTVTRIAFREVPQLQPASATAILQHAVVHPDMPPRKGYVRAELLRGVFVVQNVPRQPGVTNFTFTQQVNAGGIIPAWLMNTLIAQDAVVFVKRLGASAKRSAGRKGSAPAQGGGLSAVPA